MTDNGNDLRSTVATVRPAALATAKALSRSSISPWFKWYIHLPFVSRSFANHAEGSLIGEKCIASPLVPEPPRWSLANVAPAWPVAARAQQAEGKQPKQGLSESRPT